MGELLPKPLIEEEPKLDLKSLPKYLKYAHVGPLKILLVIITLDSLHTCLDHVGVDEFDVDKHVTEVDSLLNTPNFKATPPWTTKNRHTQGTDETREGLPNEQSFTFFSNNEV